MCLVFKLNSNFIIIKSYSLENLDEEDGCGLKWHYIGQNHIVAVDMHHIQRLNAITQPKDNNDNNQHKIVYHWIAEHIMANDMVVDCFNLF